MNEQEHQKCPRCQTPMADGKAIPTAIYIADEGTCSEAAWDGVAPLVNVLKCPSCGHSVSK